MYQKIAFFAINTIMLQPNIEQHPPISNNNYEIKIGT